jgi:hypothetical protein
MNACKGLAVMGDYAPSTPMLARGKQSYLAA